LLLSKHRPEGELHVCHHIIVNLQGFLTNDTFRRVSMRHIMYLSALSVQYLLEKVLSELTLCKVLAEKGTELFSKECLFIMEVSGARRGDTLTGV